MFWEQCQPGVTCRAGSCQIPIFQSVLGKMDFCTELGLCPGSSVGSRDSGGVGDNQSSLFAGKAVFSFPWERLGMEGRQWLRCFLGEMRPTAPLSVPEPGGEKQRALQSETRLSWTLFGGSLKRFVLGGCILHGWSSQGVKVWTEAGAAEQLRSWCW